MANKQHLKLLRQGVELWNRWRDDNPGIKPDLSKVYLEKVNLLRVNLSEANLYWASLAEAYLREANLRNANLRNAILRNADLRRANLNKANLMDAILNEADLNEVDFREAILRGAYLIRANLRDACLIDAYLNRAYLIRANLNRADLSRAKLLKADLSEADLIGVNLSRADLSGANLSRADLSGANLNHTNFKVTNLQTARLINVNLDGANLTGAWLWETQRAGWSIKGAICEYVYWDKEAKEKNEYAPGEFERLFAEQTKIKLLYKNGISPLEIATLPALIQHLEDVKDCALRFISITESAGGAVVELAIENTEDLSQEKIEVLTHSIKESAEKDMQLLRDKINVLNGTVEGFEKAIKLILTEGKGDTYNISGQAGAVGRKPRAKRNTMKSTPAKKTR
jgi:uncharacterized protein YjbI with pentapeptide repeats